MTREAQPFSNMPVAVCMGCGKPIKQREKSLRIEDQRAVDFDTREFYQVVWFYCPACKERLMNWYEEGVRGAVNREKDIQKRLAELDKEDGALPAGGC